MCFGLLFHIIWTAVPVELEPYSNLSGIGFQLSCNKAGVEKAHYKCLSGWEWKMAFGGWKGELIVVIGCGMNCLDSAELTSNVMRIRCNTRCFFELD